MRCFPQCFFNKLNHCVQVEGDVTVDLVPHGKLEILYWRDRVHSQIIFGMFLLFNVYICAHAGLLINRSVGDQVDHMSYARSLQ